MKVLKWLDENFEETILCVLLILMSVILGVQILARSLGSALTWSEEAARFMLIWSGFLSISYCIKRQISIKIDQIVELLPKSAQSVLKILEKLIMIAFYTYMLQFAWTYLQNAIQSGQTSPALHLPMYIVQFAPLFGFVLTIFRLLQGLVEHAMKLMKKAA